VTEYCSAKYVVAVANGTAALHMAALPAGFRHRNEVITSPITFVASANCIVYTGVTPMLVDIDPQTYCIDPQQVENRITSKSKGIIPFCRPVLCVNVLLRSLLELR
jgi:dTDP-4-amino-4,6-dideoxygalactose transaminase